MRAHLPRTSALCHRAVYPTSLAASVLRVTPAPNGGLFCLLLGELYLNSVLVSFSWL